MTGYDPATAPTFVWPERLKAIKDALRASVFKRK